MYSGLVSYGLKPNKMPIDYEDSLFKNVAASSSRLVVTSRQRKEEGCKTALFYLCVFGHITSTYSMKVTEYDTTSGIKHLEDEFQEVDEILEKEMKIYVYKVPPLEYTEEDLFIKFAMTALSGEAPLLAV